MFTKSFEKEAGVAGAIGRFAGGVARGAKFGAKAIGSSIKAGAKDLSSGFKQGLGPNSASKVGASFSGRNKLMQMRSSPLAQAAKIKPIGG